MNKVEELKQQKDGLDVWPDLLRYAAADAQWEDIPEDELQRMKWYGVSTAHRRPASS